MEVAVTNGLVTDGNVIAKALTATVPRPPTKPEAHMAAVLGDKDCVRKCVGDEGRGGNEERGGGRRRALGATTGGRPQRRWIVNSQMNTTWDLRQLKAMPSGVLEACAGYDDVDGVHGQTGLARNELGDPGFIGREEHGALWRGTQGGRVADGVHLPSTPTARRSGAMNGTLVQVGADRVQGLIAWLVVVLCKANSAEHSGCERTCICALGHVLATPHPFMTCDPCILHLGCAYSRCGRPSMSERHRSGTRAMLAECSCEHRAL